MTAGGCGGKDKGRPKVLNGVRHGMLPPTPKTLVRGEEGGGDPLLVKTGTPGESMGPRGGLLYVGRQAGTG